MTRSLLYPLGLLANLLFGTRFIFQWLHSERQGKSTVTRLFWVLSLIANSLMSLHAFIQLQYPLSVIQALNGAIAWRNLNLMGCHPAKKHHVFILMGSICVVVSCLFMMQGWLFHSIDWMRAPSMPWSAAHVTAIPFFWHMLGLGGMLLFASRFWIQWWQAEKHQKSYLSKPFWWISLFGALLSLIYFIRLADLVNILGYSLGLLPYVRNLMLSPSTPIPNALGKELFVFAGEPSGDVLGGKLVESLRQYDPTLAISGVGGEQMRSAGMVITHPMERLQVMGFSDVLKALPRLFGDFRAIRNQILSRQPAGVVFIDYPDFNIRLAKALRKQGYRGKLIHYVCPSVWAWRKNRVHTLAKLLDRLLSILPFEKTCFENTSLAVTYVGHPLVAAIDQHVYDTDYPLPTGKPLLAIFPGSRRHEIALNLPLQWAAAKKLEDRYLPVISVAHPDLMEEICKHVDASTHFVPQEKRYELMRAANLALATSGTIVLEIGLHAVPTVTTYQLSRFNYFLGRYLFRIHLPFYTLVNIICEKEIFPEFINKELCADKIAQALHKLNENREACQLECQSLRKCLLQHNASDQAAKTIIEELLLSSE